METVTPQGEHPLKLLERCGGYYECPRAANGRRLGPLVGYAGRYQDGSGRKLQYVGEIYANFAMAERHGAVLKWVANGLLAHLAGYTEDSDSVSFGDIVGFCGAPEGGKALANALAIAFGKQYIFPEKEVTAVKTDSSREVSRLVFDRHEPHEGECWWIMEDVCNNFSTTEAIIELINGFGARVGGILCFLNRSMVAGKAYYSSLYAREIPVVSLVHMPIPQYQQDDPVVAQDVITGNVAWKPKNEWPRLASAMAAAKEHL